MAAYNYISFEGTCANCMKTANIKVQTHMASSFNGDDDGRFCHETYKLDQRMKWWKPEHPEFEDWVDIDAKLTDSNTYLEDCYGTCDCCEKELVVVIEFKHLTPVGVKEIRAGE